MVVCMLEKLLLESKITQKTLSEDLGIHKATINNYARNKTTSINYSHLEMLCDYFKCTPNDILKVMDEDDFFLYETRISLLKASENINNQNKKSSFLKSTVVKNNFSDNDDIDWSKTLEIDHILPVESINECKKEMVINTDNLIEINNTIHKTIHIKEKELIDEMDKFEEYFQQAFSQLKKLDNKITQYKETEE